MFISIIDTLDSLFINYKTQHNEKIKEIFDIIEVDTIIRPTFIDINPSQIQIIKDNFGTQFNIVVYTELVDDINNYIKSDNKIKSLKTLQQNIKQKYFEPIQNDNIYPTNTRINIPEETTSVKTINSDDLHGKIKNQQNNTLLVVAAYEQYNQQYMKAADYSFCSTSNLDKSYNTNYKLINQEPLKNIFVLFSLNTCIVLEDNIYDIKDLIDNFDGIKLIDKLSEKLEFTDFIHKKTFNSIEECICVYNTFKNSLPKTNNVSENKIKNYINSTYEISDNIEFKIKALEFYKECKEHCKFTIDPKQFSKILLKLNLQKKRYQDGIYYYGLQKIQNNTTKIPLKSTLFFDLPIENKLPLTSVTHSKLLESKLQERKLLITKISN